jgi:hypothetical protein
MNILTQGRGDVAALKSAFQRAGLKDVRVWGVDNGKIIQDLLGPGTMLDAVRWNDPQCRIRHIALEQMI